jgi:hypothetical protein
MRPAKELNICRRGVTVVMRANKFWVGRRDSKSIVAIADSRECEFFGVALNVEANPKRDR